MRPKEDVERAREVDPAAHPRLRRSLQRYRSNVRRVMSFWARRRFSGGKGVHASIRRDVDVYYYTSIVPDFPQLSTNLVKYMPM
ncbi:unnamed protein product [Pieris macdunnoughi]|uniref:Uncharacterized protein n=1 Tax=Pieris macdunnoughi TaxID=345717 RepID=A0A821S4M7_9NEOP|nr:unnamed protein product [Pieris macdunnoughi]